MTPEEMHKETMSGLKQLREGINRLLDENYKFRQWLLTETGTDNLASASEYLKRLRLASRLYQSYTDPYEIPTAF